MGNTPQPKFHHDNQNTGLSQYNGPQNNGTKWRYKTGDVVPSSPTIGSDGTIYIGSYDEYVYALNPNGTQKWKYKTGSIIYSTPAIDSDGTIYAPSQDGTVYALNRNGTLKWKFRLGDGMPIFSSPSIATDGTLYVGSTDHNLYAVNPNGTLKWVFQTNEAIYSSPAVASDGTIYIGSRDDNLYAVNPNGLSKWTAPFHTSGDVDSSPTIASDGTIYIGSADGNLYAVKPDGTLIWSHSVGGIYSAPAIGTDGTIYVGSANTKIYALNNIDGSEKWTYTTGGPTFSSPCVAPDGTVYIGTMDGYFYAVNSTGNLKWKYKTGNYVESSAAIGSDGTLYIGSDDNYLYALHTDTTAPKVTASPVGGTYNADKKVYLTISELGTVYYTLNGTNPTTSSTRYTGPITITKTTTIKFFAVDLRGLRSNIYSQTYTIDKVAPKLSSTTPSNNALNIPLTSPIIMKFTENIFASTSYSKIYIKNLKTGKTVAITKTISGNTLTIKHSIFTGKTSYQVYIPVAAVKDKAGNQLKTAYTYQFKTR